MPENLNTIYTPAVDASTRETFAKVAAAARLTGRLAEEVAAFWDGIVANNSDDTKRTDLIDAALVATGQYREEPKWEGGKRTPYGNVVQAYGYHLDAARKRASAGDDTDDTDNKEEQPKNLLTRAGLAASLEDVIAAWKIANNEGEEGDEEL